MLCDHPLSTSGVGTQARWLITGLLGTGKYSFKVFGGALKHEDYNVITVNQDFIIKPTNGFGDKNTLRKAIAQEQPDALFLFTDPRFFIWVWEMEDEIRSVCPIVYNHLWDNPPWPEFNRVLYESTDLINCINWPTYEMVKERFPEKTNYIPHAIPKNVYFPMNKDDVSKAKKQLLGESRLDHFILTFVSRNARRKMPSDILVSFQQFLNELQLKHGHKKATMLMHTEPLDPEGPNLNHVIDLLGIRDNVVFSKDRVGFNEMNALYNITDVVVNRSCNEGFGLGVLEAKMAGKLAIALKTGGLTRQIEDWKTGEQFGIGLEPEVKCMVGNQMVPYIYEDFVSHETVAKAMMELYNWGPEKRQEIGMKAMHHAHRDYGIDMLVNEWDRTLSDLFIKWNQKPARWSKTEL